VCNLHRNLKRFEYITCNVLYIVLHSVQLAGCQFGVLGITTIHKQVCFLSILEQAPGCLRSSLSVLMCLFY